MKHYVHAYVTIRVKTEVDAPDHPAAMKVADSLLFDNGLAVRLTPTADCVLEAEYAEEVTGYLVEKDDGTGSPDYEDSKDYGPDHEPEVDLKALLKEAGAILDEIDDLPMADDGSRELPAGMLDRAREIAALAARL